jgi:hypothetical protein
MNDVTLVITKDDIACGGSNPTDCPIALAAKRRLPGSKPRVGWRIIQLFEKDYQLPAEATKFVALFDVGWHVDPFKFTLALENPNEKTD